MKKFAIFQKQFIMIKHFFFRIFRKTYLFIFFATLENCSQVTALHYKKL